MGTKSAFSDLEGSKSSLDNCHDLLGSSTKSCSLDNYS